MTDAEALAHHRRANRLDAVHLHLRPPLLDGDGDPANEPATTDWHDDIIEVVQLLEDLEGDGSLPCHDFVIVEGMHDREGTLLRQLVRARERLYTTRAVEHDLRTIAAA